MFRTTVLLALLLTTLPMTATAQTPREAWWLRTVAARQEDVTVDLTNGGGQIRGRLLQSAYATLEIETSIGVERVNLAHVARVRRVYDPVIDGAMRGVVSATLVCIVTCERGASGSVTPGSAAGHMLVGGLIGGAIDRIIPNGQTIYRRRVQPGISIGIRRPRVLITVLF